MDDYLDNSIAKIALLKDEDSKVDDGGDCGCEDGENSVEYKHTEAALAESKNKTGCTSMDYLQLPEGTPHPLCNVKEPNAASIEYKNDDADTENTATFNLNLI